MDGDQHGLVVCRAKLPGRVPQTRGATLDLVSPGRSPGRGCRYPVPGRHPRRHPTCALIWAKSGYTLTLLRFLSRSSIRTVWRPCGWWTRRLTC